MIKSPAAVSSFSGERLARRLRGRVKKDYILRAFQRVPRTQFLDDSMINFAGDDAALPIGHEQTTSSPLVIALMLEMMFAGLPPPTPVLEIGSGCGYQTALLASLGCEVVGLERIRALVAPANRRLRDLQYNSAKILHRDGMNGYPEKMPYGGIVLCAECDEADVPAALWQQLQAQGRLVAPLYRDGRVRLTALNANGKIVERRDEVSFVPMRKGLQ